MTQQQLQYAYWQRMRQLQTYRSYVAGASNSVKNSYKSIKKVSDNGFLNYIEYDASNISPDKVNQRFKSGNSDAVVSNGMCTGVYSASQKKVLRQLDWYYNNEVEFIVKMNKCPEKKVKYDSIGTTAASPKLTKDIAQHLIESGEYYEYFDLLPYMTVDGVNEKGIFAQSNVVEKNGVTPININPDGEDCCCSIMLVRFILDRVDDIVNDSDSEGQLLYELRKLHLYGIPEQYIKQYNSHILVVDAKGNSRVIEFNTDSFEITSYPIMTNFRTNGALSVNDDYMPDWSTIEHNGCGVERWETAARWLSGSTQNFYKLRKKLDYTNSYVSCYDAQSIMSAWITECLSDDLSVFQAKDYHDNPVSSQYKGVIDAHMSAYFDLYKNRSRETAKTWITTHSSIYDLTALSCNVVSQVGTSEETRWNVKFSGEISADNATISLKAYLDMGETPTLIENPDISVVISADSGVEKDYKFSDFPIEVEPGTVVQLSGHPVTNSDESEYYCKGWQDYRDNPYRFMVEGNCTLSAMCGKRISNNSLNDDQTNLNYDPLDELLD